MNNIDGTTDCDFKIHNATLSCLNSKNSMTTFEKSFVNCRNTIDDKLYSLTKKQYLSSPGPIDIDAEEKKIINNEIQKIKETNESCIYMYKQLPECKKEGHCKYFWSKKIKHRNMVCDGLKVFDNPDVADFCSRKESTNLGHTSSNNIDGTSNSSDECGKYLKVEQVGLYNLCKNPLARGDVNSYDKCVKYLNVGQPGLYKVCENR